MANKPYTIAELVNTLMQIKDQNMPVYMSKDAEGNSFKPFDGIQIDNGIGKDGYPDMNAAKKVLILWPR